MAEFTVESGSEKKAWKSHLERYIFDNAQISARFDRVDLNRSLAMLDPHIPNPLENIDAVLQVLKRVVDEGGRDVANNLASRIGYIGISCIQLKDLWERELLSPEDYWELADLIPSLDRDEYCHLVNKKMKKKAKET